MASSRGVIFVWVCIKPMVLNLCQGHCGPWSEVAVRTDCPLKVGVCWFGSLLTSQHWWGGTHSGCFHKYLLEE